MDIAQHYTYSGPLKGFCIPRETCINVCVCVCLFIYWSLTSLYKLLMYREKKIKMSLVFHKRRKYRFGSCCSSLCPAGGTTDLHLK